MDQTKSLLRRPDHTVTLQIFLFLSAWWTSDKRWFILQPVNFQKWNGKFLQSGPRARRCLEGWVHILPDPLIWAIPSPCGWTTAPRRKERRCSVGDTTKGDDTTACTVWVCTHRISAQIKTASLLFLQGHLFFPDWDCFSSAPFKQSLLRWQTWSHTDETPCVASGSTTAEITDYRDKKGTFDNRVIDSV